MAKIIKTVFLISLFIQLFSLAPVSAQPNKDTVSQAREASHISRENLQRILLTENFKILTTKQSIPDSVVKKIGDIAEPNASINVTDVIVPGENLPFRRLIFGGLSTNFCIVHYEKGGIAHTYNVQVFKLSKQSAELIWAGYLNHRLKDTDELREAVKIKEIHEDYSYL